MTRHVVYGNRKEEDAIRVYSNVNRPEQFCVDLDQRVNDA
jgi:hypothetical protein